MNELQIFNSEEFGEIRTVTKDGKTLFVGNDVAAALGYVEKAKAVRTHCKGMSEMDIPTNGGVQTVKVITEGDIYRLVVKSQLHKLRSLNHGFSMKFFRLYERTAAT